MKVKHLNKISIALLVAVQSSFYHSVAQDTPESSLVETAQAAGAFNTLLAAAQAAGLVEYIDSAVPKTVFAPTDAAFAALPEGTVASLLQPENLGALRQILRYHIVEGVVTSDMLSSGYVETAARSGLKVTVGAGVLLNDSSSVISADIAAKNGVIHVIDSVLLPPSGTVVDRLAADPDFSILVAAATAAGQVDALNSLRPLTVFAPTNAAFEALPEGTVESLLQPENLELLQNILHYHIVTSSIFSNQLSDGLIPTLSGGTLEVDMSGPVFRFDGGAAAPVAVDIIANNGVIHKIDRVLLPHAGGIPETLVNDGRFNTVVAAAQAAGLVDALGSLSGITLFAPTDDAFNALPAGTVEFLLQPENAELLGNVLLYHVVPGNLYAGDLVTNVYETATGVDVPVMVTDAGVWINEGPQVVDANLLASNGVIHAVNQVILPPLNLGDTLAARPEYSTLVAALNAAGLFDVLNSPGPFTLFAPTNDAFAKLPAGTVETLLQPENLDTLTSILLAHVVGDRLRGGNLLTQSYATLQGKTLQVHWVGGELRIADEAVITRTDLPTWNGTIHQIDTVLLP